MPHLTQITKAASSTDEKSEIQMTFDTGETFTITSLDLRFECPCATCVDEMTGKKTLKRESINPKIKPLDIQPVGRYGIAIRWSDGHSTGMYHFDRLYEIAKAWRKNHAHSDRA